MQTSKFEVYKPLRKHRSKAFYVLLLCYVTVVIARICTMFFIGWVIESYAPHELQEQSTSADTLNFSTLKEQKYFYVSALLKFRIFNNSFSFKKKYLDYGELVVVKLHYPLKDDVSIMSSVRMVASILTFGIVKSRAPLVLRYVVAVPGDTVVYNAKQLLSVNENNYSVSDIDTIPFLGTTHTTLLGAEEYFLVGLQEYEIDDRLLGPSTISAVRGKVLFKLGPEWGPYFPTQDFR